MIDLKNLRVGDYVLARLPVVELDLDDAALPIRVGSPDIEDDTVWLYAEEIVGIVDRAVEEGDTVCVPNSSIEFTVKAIRDGEAWITSPTAFDRIRPVGELKHSRGQKSGDDSCPF